MKIYLKKAIIFFIAVLVLNGCASGGYISETSGSYGGPDMFLDSRQREYEQRINLLETENKKQTKLIELLESKIKLIEEYWYVRGRR